MGLCETLTHHKAASQSNGHTLENEALELLFISDRCEVIASSETWITSGHTPAQLIDLPRTRYGYDLVSCPRISR